MPVLSRLSACALVGFLVACSASAPAAPTAAPTQPAQVTATQPTAAPTAAPAPKRGGAMVIGTTLDPGQFNPGITTAGGTHFVSGNIFNGLLQLDEQFNPQPDLAASWTISPDGLARQPRRTGMVGQVAVTPMTGV